MSLACLPFHHPGKDEAKGGRGHSSVLGGTDTEMVISKHTLSFTTAPASPFRVGVWDSADAIDSRWSSDTTTVNGAHNSSTTSLSVDIADGVLWDDTDGDFDIMVAGERMTVTAVAGASSPQTFTVTRSVNGVTKSHSDGEAVRLFTSAHWSL